MAGAPPAPRQPAPVESDWSLAELGRSMTSLTGAVTNLSTTVGKLAETVAVHSARLGHLEKFAYSTAGAVVSLAAGALLSGHVHLS